MDQEHIRPAPDPLSPVGRAAWDVLTGQNPVAPEPVVSAAEVTVTLTVTARIVVGFVAGGDGDWGWPPARGGAAMLIGGRYVGEDEMADYRLQTAMAGFDERAVTCASCGHEWDPGYHRASRIDPGWEDRPECPECGSDERVES